MNRCDWCLREIDDAEAGLCWTCVDEIRVQQSDWEEVE